MPEENGQPTAPDQNASPPPPPPAGGPPPPPPSSSGGGGGSKTGMLVLAYLGIFAIIPLVSEKDDPEVQWHAKHGLVLMVAWIVLFIVLGILTFIPMLGAIIGCGLYPILSLVILIVHILAIVKATKGERLLIPGVSDFVEKF